MAELQRVWSDQGDRDLANDARRVLAGLQTLAHWVALGDSELSAPESAAIEAIFGSADPQPSSDGQCAPEPDIDVAKATVLEAITIVPSVSAAGERHRPEDNLIYRAVEIILETVIAADGALNPEAERLERVLNPLRQAAMNGPRTAPTGPPDDEMPPASEQAGTPANDDMTSILRELDALVGLASIKREVRTLTNLARVFAMRREMKLPVPTMSFHLVFLGNPGTGKTTVARIIARIYGKLGLLSKGQLVEVDRAGLVANYVGQTATKVAAVLNEAAGGVLFIDEAYALDGGHANDFGHEAVATLIKGMEDHRNDLVVIAAGYPDQMHRFLDINPGLRSRMSRELVFEDYTPDEMAAIFTTMAGASGYLLDAGVDAAALAHFRQLWEKRGKDFANARDVRNFLERVIGAQADRICGIDAPTPAEIQTLLASDIEAALAKA